MTFYWTVPAWETCRPMYLLHVHVFRLRISFATVHQGHICIRFRSITTLQVKRGRVSWLFVSLLVFFFHFSSYPQPYRPYVAMCLQPSSDFCNMRPEPKNASETTHKQPGHYSTKLVMLWYFISNSCCEALTEPVWQLKRGETCHRSDSIKLGA